MVFATMGSNYGDFDNDGWLDMYLGTGDPDISTLVPNRMFKNVGGRGLLISRHPPAPPTCRRATAWPVATGIATAMSTCLSRRRRLVGDRYHNILFQNPGQGNHWLTVKLVGKKSNRAAVALVSRSSRRASRPLPFSATFRRAAASEPARSSRRSGWQSRREWFAWKSTGRPAARPRSSATFLPIKRSKSPSSSPPIAGSRTNRFRNQSDRSPSSHRRAGNVPRG